MSFTIDLMYNASDDNVLNKSLNTLGSYTGVLKAKTSILTPGIMTTTKSTRSITA